MHLVMNLQSGLLCSLAIIAACGDSSTPAQDAAPVPADAAAPGNDADVGPLTTGRVVDRFLRPLANVPVAIVDHGMTTTDADGRYAFSQVTTPYSLIVVDASASAVAPEVLIYEGVVRDDAQVVLFPAGESQPDLWFSHSSVLDLDVGDGLTAAVAALPNMSASGAPITVQTLRFEPLRWIGGDTTPVVVHGLTWEEDPSTQLPTTMLAAGDLTTTVHDQMAASAGPISLAPCKDGTFSFSLGLPPVPPLFPTPVWQVSWQYEDGSAIELGTATGLSAALAVPDIAGRVALQGDASSEHDGSLFFFDASPASADVRIVVLPAIPALAVPGDGADVAPAQIYSWDGPSSTYTLRFQRLDAPGPTISLATRATSAELPDLSALGLGWPAGATYAWSVSVDTAVPEVDALLDPTLQRPWGAIPPSSFTSTSPPRTVLLVP
jgi:hypothetical protein